MTREEIRIECLHIVVECREAGQGAAEMIALASALEAYVTTSVRTTRKMPTRKKEPIC